MTERWIEVARGHPSVERVGEAWKLIVQAVTGGAVPAEDLLGVVMQLQVGGDVVLGELGMWPSGSQVIVEHGSGSATVDRQAFLDVLTAAIEAL